MEKYLGNKKKFCEIIYEELQKYMDISAGMSFFDIFSGTTNVSRFFKSKGFNIICNDINDLSFVLAHTYIKCCRIPQFHGLYMNDEFLYNLENAQKSKDFISNLERLIKENQNVTEKDFLATYKESKMFEILTYLTYYCGSKDYKNIKYNFFQDNYCNNGKNARYINLVHAKSLQKIKQETISNKVRKNIDLFFKYPYDEKYLYIAKNELKRLDENELHNKISGILSKKNLTGERLFFSDKHASRLDHIFNTICYWKNNDLINFEEYYILLTSLIETVTIFSNTSATYQAFYKNLRANTKQNFRLVIPQLDLTKINSTIYKEDAFSLISNVNADIIYLDPPYNWRQYDSNYHLLNSIARFNDLPDKELFQKQIVGASGENRIQKLKYTSFNTRSTFKDLLLYQLKNAKCKYVVLSYSDSLSNHERKNTDIAIKDISNFFGNKKIFSEYKVVKIKSHNFESRKNNKKEIINELLFIAKKI